MATTKITEAQLSRAIQDFLRIDGWRVFKQEPLSRAGGGRYAGEVGMPDLLALRYKYPLPAANAHAECQAIWIEVKRKGAKPKQHQLEWHQLERELGAEVFVCDDYDEFRSWYINSGLNRNIRA